MKEKLVIMIIPEGSSGFRLSGFRTSQTQIHPAVLVLPF